MIGTLFRINWINLKRDKVALGLTFVLPVVFFSIFALIFGGMSGGSGGGGSSSIRVIVVDEDKTDVSRRFTEAIDAQGALKIYTTPPATEDVPEPAPYTRETAKQTVRGGKYPVAIVIPEGFGEQFGNFVGDQAEVELIYDAANPIALNTTGGLLQAASFMAAPDILMEGGLEQLELAGGFL
ncbi:MAG: ABC transporter permease, partial [Planctomycetota bacterium]|nr:ABC transporter permease [Planctomycetota bacterium]